MSIWTRFWDAFYPEPHLQLGEKALHMVPMVEPTATVISVNDPETDDFDA